MRSTKIGMDETRNWIDGLLLSLLSCHRSVRAQHFKYDFQSNLLVFNSLALAVSR